MKKVNLSTSACRYCRHYEPVGRRGGSCKLLGVPVKSSWKACAFASPSFESTLKKLEDIFQLETSISLESTERAIDPLLNIGIRGHRPQMAAPKIE